MRPSGMSVEGRKGVVTLLGPSWPGLESQFIASFFTSCVTMGSKEPDFPGS